MNKSEISIPRNQLFMQAVSHLYSPSDEIKQNAPLTTYNIEETRRECVYQFLERSFLPRMQDEKPFTVGELVQSATEFKLAFRQEHPQDFVGEFELITDVEFQLQQLHVYYKSRQATKGEWSKTAELVERGLTELKPLLENHPDDLFSI